MASSDTTRWSLRGPLGSAVTWGVLATIAALVVGALILSNTYTARSVTSDANRLYAATSTLAANDLALKALTQATLLREDELLGVADAATSGLALNEARTAIAELNDRGESLLTTLEAEAGPLQQQLAVVAQSSTRVLDALEAGDVVLAGTVLPGETKAQYEQLRDSVNGIRQAARAVIDESERQMGRVAAIIAFAIAFLVPAAAIFGYRQLAQRQLHIAEAEIEVRLEAEQTITDAKDEFIASISHELRTPLTSIYGFSEVLLELGFVDPATTEDLVGHINREAGEMARMVEDLLTMARQQIGSLVLSFGPVDLSTEVEAVITPLHRVGVEVNADVPPAVVWADTMRVRQIIRNLVSNAQRHGGPIIHIRTETEEDQVRLTVADNGPGVAADKVSQLFSRFIHDGDATLLEGSVGLGLAVIKGLLDEMGGSIRYHRNGDWSEFVVTLRRIDEEAESWPEEDGDGDLPLAAAGLA